MNTQSNSHNPTNKTEGAAHTRSLNVPVIVEQKQEDRFHVKHLINNELNMESNQIIIPATGQCPLKRVANRVLTLLVNGIPTLKLNNLSELPEQTGSESWALIDHDGLTLASYFPVPFVNLPQTV